MAARAAGVLPEGVGWPEQRSYEPRCVEALPALEELGGEGTDSWSAVARGLKTLCLERVSPERHEEIRAGARAYLDLDDQENSLDRLLRRTLKIALWRVDGPPEFEAEALDGGKVTLASFQGKLTLLDFWSPG